MPRFALPFLAWLTAALFAGGASAARSEASTRLGRSERAVIHLVNDIRGQYGLRRLRGSYGLHRAARRHSRDMLRRNFFGHPSSDGTSFDRRVRRYAKARRVGETLAVLGQRGGAAATVVRMWMESPAHRAVLLTPGFRRIGVAHAWGFIGGARRMVVTADFASGR